MEWGKQYFYTATIINWYHILKNDAYKQVIIDLWKFQVKEERMIVYGFVIMPNHYHAIFSFLPPKQPWETMRDTHKFISWQIINDLEIKYPKAIDKLIVDKRDRKIQIWQRNSLPIHLYNREIAEQKLIYIHNNPLQNHWQLAEIPEEYQFSSAKFYLLENERKFDFLTHYLC